MKCVLVCVFFICHGRKLPGLGGKEGEYLPVWAIFTQRRAILQIYYRLSLIDTCRAAARPPCEGVIKGSDWT
jgi:hypothetical protein